MNYNLTIASTGLSGLSRNLLSTLCSLRARLASPVKRMLGLHGYDQRSYFTKLKDHTLHIPAILKPLARGERDAVEGGEYGEREAEIHHPVPVWEVYKNRAVPRIWHQPTDW